MLKKWRQLSPEAALELLDHQYADIQVRDWAVQCLECVGDNKLIMYLLQLVQALKFEPYLECALGQFLLRRALQNKVIGHFLFWHLRYDLQLTQLERLGFSRAIHPSLPHSTLPLTHYSHPSHPLFPPLTHYFPSLSPIISPPSHPLFPLPLTHYSPSLSPIIPLTHYSPPSHPLFPLPLTHYSSSLSPIIPPP